MDESLSSSISDIFPDGGKRDDSTNHDTETTLSLSFDGDDDDDDDGDNDGDLGGGEESSEKEGKSAECQDDPPPQTHHEGKIKSLAQELGTLEIGSKRTNNHRRKSKPLQTAFKSVVKSLVVAQKLHRNLKQGLTLTLGGSNQKRRRVVSFAKEAPSWNVVDQNYTPGEMEALWYSDEEYEAIRKGALMALEDLLLESDGGNTNTTNNPSEPAGRRGAKVQQRNHPTTTAQALIAERRRYKIASRHVVFDEQEEQRLSKKSRDPEKVRRLYGEATSRSSRLARDSGRQHEEDTMRLWNTNTNNTNGGGGCGGGSPAEKGDDINTHSMLVLGQRNSFFFKGPSTFNSSLKL